MYCSECGAKLPQETAFCGQCGTATTLKGKNNTTQRINAFDIARSFSFTELLRSTVILFIVAIGLRWLAKLEEQYNLIEGVYRNATGLDSTFSLTNILLFLVELGIKLVFGLVTYVGGYGVAAGVCVMAILAVWKIIEEISQIGAWYIFAKLSGDDTPYIPYSIRSEERERRKREEGEKRKIEEKRAQQIKAEVTESLKAGRSKAYQAGYTEAEPIGYEDGKVKGAREGYAAGYNSGLGG